jgi:hypothetical protein
MKKATFIVTLVSLLATTLFAQRSKMGASPAGGSTPAGAGAGGGGAKASAAGGAATSGTQETGFVYYLKYKKHLQYAALKTETHYFTKAMFVSNHISQIFGDPVDLKNLVTATFILDRKPIKSVINSGIASFREYDIRLFTKQTTNILPPITGNDTTRNDTVLAVTIMYYDSLPRFWNIERSSIFTKSRLRISLTQDTAILKAKILYNNFESDIDTNSYAVSNPNFMSSIYKGEKHEFIQMQQQQQINQVIEINYIGFNKMPSNSPGTFSYHSLNVQKHPLTYIDADSDYSNLLKSYKSYLRAYDSSQFVAQKKNFLDTSLNRYFIRRYDTLKIKYYTLLRQYHEISSLLTAPLDIIRYDILDPTKIEDTIKNQLAFISGLYDLYSLKFKPPPILPKDIVNKTKREIAISISNSDSASNFYFNIIHKSLVNQPIFYGKFHYGTWDYGSITVPFRYRPGPPNRHVISQAGKDTSTISATSASDATINLSLYIGRKWGHTRFYEDPTMTVNTVSIEPVAITGPSLIALSLSNVDSSSRFANYKTQYNYTGPSNIIAWSFGGGLVLQYKTINLGVFVGTDVPLTGHTGWVYAYRPWFGFGIGVNLGMLSSGNAVN